ALGGWQRPGSEGCVALRSGGLTPVGFGYDGRGPPGFSPATEWPKWIADFLPESYGSGKESLMSHHAKLRQGGFSQSRRRQRMFLLLVLVLCCLGSTKIVSAGVNAWTGIRPECALVTSLAMGPTAPLILYATNCHRG